MHQIENKQSCPQNFSCLAPYFDVYEGELKQLILELDNLVERKKLEWTSKIHNTETQLQEEKRLHDEAKATLIKRDREIGRIIQHANSLRERNEIVKSDYERKIADLRQATKVMSENLSALQQKYCKWRSRACTSVADKRSIGTYVNSPPDDVHVHMPTDDGRTSLANCQKESQSQFASKNSEIFDHRDLLNSFELAFRTQVGEVERQLRDIVSLKQIQDKEIIMLKRQIKHRTATRNFRHQWPPSTQGLLSETSTQTPTINAQSISTMTNPKYLGPSATDIAISNLKNEISTKNTQIGKLEDACGSAMEVIRKLEKELEGSRGALDQKCAELAQEKVAKATRERRGFQSKACQTKQIDSCDQEVDVRLIESHWEVDQLPGFPVEVSSPSNNLPGFLTDSLMALRKKSCPGNENLFRNRNVNQGYHCQMKAPKDTVPNDTQISLPSRTEVDVSVEDTEPSQNIGPNVQALIADWKSTEDQWIGQLKSSSMRDHTTILTLPGAISISTPTKTAPTSSSTLTDTDKAGMFASSSISSPCEGRSCELIRGMPEVSIPSLETVATAFTPTTGHNFTRSTPIEGQKNISKKSQPFAMISRSSRFVSSSGDVGDAGNPSAHGKDSFFGLNAWEEEDDDDNMDHLADRFLATEQAHALDLEQMIDQHLLSLRLEADLGIVSSRSPLVHNGEETVYVPVEY